LPHPVAHVELHSPIEQESAVVCELEHARAQPPQSAVFASVLVSHPFEGSPTQWPKPEAHVSEQSLLHDPWMALQHVVPVQTTEPAFSE
jgi:hypothetical protein